MKYNQQKEHWTDQIKWASKEEVAHFIRERNELLNAVAGRIQVSFDNHKPHVGPLSPGCITCSSGNWSCMYITKKCTANCFFCPQARDVDAETPPTAEGITFNDPQDYVAYIKAFNIAGVSFSGGEPLMVPNKLLAFVKTIRQEMGKDYYLWMYTNGQLIDEDILNRLAKAGLNEIRFDICADNYRLEFVKLATRYIKNVTVEIPTIPDDIDIIKNCLLPLKQAGVRFVNLHQMILSKHNYRSFLTRDYTYVRSSQFDPRVLDSELTALKIIKYTLDNNINLPVNYCSKPYKNRFQETGIKRTTLKQICRDHEEISDTGYLKRLTIVSSPHGIKEIQKLAGHKGLQHRMCVLDLSCSEAFIHPSLLEHIDCLRYSFNLGYYAPRLKTHGNFCSHYPSITLKTGKKIQVRLKKVFEKKGLSIKAVKQFEHFFQNTMAIDRDIVPVTF